MKQTTLKNEKAIISLQSSKKNSYKLTPNKILTSLKNWSPNQLSFLVISSMVILMAFKSDFSVNKSPENTSLTLTKTAVLAETTNLAPLPTTSKFVAPSTNQTANMENVMPTTTEIIPVGSYIIDMGVKFYIDGQI